MSVLRLTLRIMMTSPFFFYFGMKSFVHNRILQLIVHYNKSQEKKPCKQIVYKAFSLIL